MNAVQAGALDLLPDNAGTGDESLAEAMTAAADPRALPPRS